MNSSESITNKSILHLSDLTAIDMRIYDLESDIKNLNDDF